MDRWLRREGTVDDLLEHVNEEFAVERPWLWCERIQVETGSVVDRSEVARREDFTGDLARLVDELAGSPEALDEIRRSLRDLYETQRARRYLWDLLPGDEELKRILAAAEEECLAELSDEGDGS